MTKPLKVLLVEDDEDDVRLALRMLRLGGFDPTWRRVQDAASLREALAGERWDAVLSDFRLPKYSGLDALAEFRSAALDIPFIFVSGTIGEEMAVAAMKGGASDYVMKQNLARLAPALERELNQAQIRAEHRKGQVELELSRDRYVDLYEFAPVGYLTLSPEGLLEQVNLAGAEMLGAPREHLLHRRFVQFVNPADTDRWHEHFVLTLHHGTRQRLELSLRGQKNSPLHVQIDCMRVTQPGDRTVVRVALTDISDRKAAEADLRRFEAQLRDVQKMESIGTLAGGIAHDFNNILGAILGNVVMAQEQLGNDHAAAPSLGEILKASLRARHLVQQILTFSRREPQELVRQPLRPVLEETHQLLRAILPAGIDIELALPEAPLYVRADATQLQQVLMNLCTNAWHALKDGAGRIAVGLEPATLDLSLSQRLGGAPPGPYAHLWVRDTGCGMDATTRARIFEPFYTTKPVGQGTGLGLSVVHGILTAHHGAIAVDSAPGQGSTFHLYLPVSDPSPAAPGLTDAAAAPARGHGEHVLYVDDDPTMVVMVERLLERNGYRVSAYQDPRAAIDAMRNHPGNFDVVVTDFNMPELSGLDVAQEVARVAPRLPVVISSGYITDELREHARCAGVRSLLEKQNTFEDLGPLLGRILAQRHEPPR